MIKDNYNELKMRFAKVNNSNTTINENKDVNNEEESGTYQRSLFDISEQEKSK